MNSNQFISVLCFTLLLAVFVNSCCENCANSVDYYWRDYTTFIPKDAIPGGTDRGGNPSFIGSTFFPQYGLLPTNIFCGDSYAHGTVSVNPVDVKVNDKNGKTCNNGNTTSFEAKSNRNTKILCSASYSKPRWVPVNITRMNLLTNCTFIQGGFELGFPLLIGRINIDGQVVVGKVNPNDGLEVAWNGKSRKHVKKFEMLGYCCD